MKDGLYTRHEVACIIADLFGGTCACDYSGNDEWLPQYCEFAETVCPNTVGVACWEQYLEINKGDARIKAKIREFDSWSNDMLWECQKWKRLDICTHCLNEMSIYIKQKVVRND